MPYTLEEINKNRAKTRLKSKDTITTSSGDVVEVGYGKKLNPLTNTTSPAGAVIPTDTKTTPKKEESKVVDRFETTGEYTQNVPDFSNIKAPGSEMAEDLFGDEGKGVFQTTQEKADAMLAKHAEEKQSYETEKSALEAELERQTIAAKEQTSSASAATTAALATDREAVTVETRPFATAQINEGFQRRLDSFLAGKSAQERKQEALGKQLIEAQRLDKQGLVIDIQKEIDASKTALAEAEAALIEEQDKQVKTAMEITDQITAFMTGNETDADLFQIASERGADIFTLTLARNAAALKRFDQQDKDTFEKQKAVRTQINSFIDNGILATMTSGQIMSLEKDGGYNPGTLTGAALRLKELEKMDDETRKLETAKLRTDINKGIADINKITAETKALNGATEYNGQNLLAELATYQIGDVKKRPEGPGKQYEGQCAAFVNDMIGKPARYSSSYASKYSHINNWDVENPTVGSIFVSTMGNSEIGHCGFIESINDDGTVTIVDSNRNGKGKIDRRTVNINELRTKEKIVGYEDLAVTQAGMPRLSDKEKVDLEIQLGTKFDAIVKEPRKALEQLGIMEESLALLQEKELIGEDGFLNPSSQAILVTFQKILDPTSVVRESEYARSGDGQALAEEAEGWLKKLASGGAGVTIENLEAFVETAERFMVGYENSIISASDRTVRQANRYGLDLESIIPSDVVDIIESRKTVDPLIQPKTPDEIYEEWDVENVELNGVLDKHGLTEVPETEQELLTA